MATKEAACLCSSLQQRKVCYDGDPRTYRLHRSFRQQGSDRSGKNCDDNRTGGCLFICDKDGNQLLHKMVGAPDESKMAKYREFSREKAMRLLSNSEHLTSRESRNPEANQYGGAIRLPLGYITSFSGFSEEDDEFFSLALAMALYWVSFQDCGTTYLPWLHNARFSAVRRIVHDQT